MVAGSPDLREYEAKMWTRHADALAVAIAADRGRPDDVTASDRALARFVLGVYPLARDAPDPDAAIDEIMDLVSAAWHAAHGPEL
jgi:hypothetical protein